MKKASVPSCCLLTSVVLLIQSGRSISSHVSPCLVPMKRVRCGCRAGQWKTTWSPSCVWCWQALHVALSALSIWKSHCFIGPRLVLVQVYAESARLFHWVSLPRPRVALTLWVALASLCTCLMPAVVAVYGSLSSWPVKLLWPAALPASSLPVIPICDRTPYSTYVVTESSISPPRRVGKSITLNDIVPSTKHTI